MHQLQMLVERAGLTWFRQQVDGHARLAIRCSLEQVRDTITRLFNATRNIEDQTHKIDVLSALATLQSDRDDVGLVLLYWPVDILDE